MAQPKKQTEIINTAEARRSGMESFYQGKSKVENPYKTSYNRIAWYAGYDDAKYVYCFISGRNG